MPWFDGRKCRLKSGVQCGLKFKFANLNSQERSLVKRSKWLKAFGEGEPNGFYLLVLIEE